ncbi:MAG: DUF1501 domain-containing protein [Gemmataceae bacterium]|nr:DUF1501 domain-containing protein [Gemmataceae bacterium]MCI0737498.1 DUF1501 domain-containing protein [Gemmataceae bacterium]
MLGLTQQPVPLCDGLTRREWLRVGGLSTIGLSLPEVLRARAVAQSPLATFGRAKSCIVVFLFGAPAHQDIWDLKPNAPSEYRGEFQPIASNVPGIQVGEHIPRLAQLANRYAIVRSVSHPDDTHTVAMHYMLTGVRHAQPATNPRNQPTDFPTFGAVLNYLRRDNVAGTLRVPSGLNGTRSVPTTLPAGISLNSPANQMSANNHIFPGFFAGLIGAVHDPLFIPQDPNRSDFRPFPTLVEEVGGPRKRLRERMERLSRQATQSATQSFDYFYRQAFDLVTSPAARRAFDLTGEPVAVRDRYGRNSFGQSLLLARRLVEGGVPLITVNWARDDAFWDTHARNFQQLKETLLPPFDLGFSALLMDLHDRGLLEETLVVCLGEFGRTPRINRDAGRDHWAACNSVVFAGGGVRGGQVIGASDRIAAYPASTPFGPADVAATIYHALGIPLDTELRDVQGRPLTLCSGRSIDALFAQ